MIWYMPLTMWLDLCAAFDTVDHNILLSVLRDQFAIENTTYNGSSHICQTDNNYLSTTINKLSSVHWTAVQHNFHKISVRTARVCRLHRRQFRRGSKAGYQRTCICRWINYIQSCTNCFSSDVARAWQGLSECTADLVVWCAQRRLQLNANKTEVLSVGSRRNLTKLANEDLSLTIALKTVQPSDVVRDVDVWLYSELSLRQHVTKIDTSCFYQLLRLRQVHRRAGREVDTRLVLVLVIFELDYCNSVLACLPTSTSNGLQIHKVQNTAVRLICQLRPRDHVSSLQQLHWLPIRSCVLYKLMSKSTVVKLQNTSPTLSAQLLQRQHDPATFYLGFGLNSEDKLFRMLDQQPGADFHRTFVHRPLWTFLNGNWRHVYIQKLLIRLRLLTFYYFNVWHCNAPTTYIIVVGA